MAKSMQNQSISDLHPVFEPARPICFKQIERVLAKIILEIICYIINKYSDHGIKKK
jgi:hypothetical protein